MAVKEEEVNLEDIVFKKLGIDAPQDPPELFLRFIDEIAPLLSLGKMSYGILEAFSTRDVKSEKVSRFLKQNPYFEYYLLHVVSALANREDYPVTESALVMLGMQNSRNLLLTLQMYRVVEKLHPEWETEGKLKISPADYLNFCLKTEELFAKDKEGFADSAYSAGFIFDLLVLIANKLSDDPKTILTFIEEQYNHGLRTGRLGMTLAKSIPKFSYTKYVFGACLIHDIGKSIMAILDPSYVKFDDEISKKNLPRQVRMFAEEKQFGIGHQVLGGLACQYIPSFQPVSMAILYHHDPQLLKSVNLNLYQLAAVICLSTNVIHHPEPISGADDPIGKLWKTPELTGFPIALHKISDTLVVLKKTGLL